MPAILIEDAPTRASLLNFLTGQIGALPGAVLTRTELAQHLAVLDTGTIAGCLRQTGDLTADALTVAIRRRAADLEPGEAIGDLIADTCPRLSYADRERLRLLTQAIRELAQVNDGVVTDRDLAARGFSVGEQTRFVPQATELLARLEGRTSYRDGRDTLSPAARLAAIGGRVYLRRAGRDTATQAA